MEPNVSIIVPIYNVETYLTNCISSILNQSYENYEILLIDDGSTDSSGKLADSFSLKDNRIRVYHKTNGGLSDARNYGIDRARGKFYIFIDSDDLVHKDFLSELIKMQTKYNAEITSVNLLPFSDLRTLEDVSYDSDSYQVYSGIDILKEYFSPRSDIIINHGLCMKLYKSDLFSDIRFDKGKLHEDLFITYKLLSKCRTFVYSSKPYYFYFQNPTSICNNYKTKNFINEYEATICIKNFFKNNSQIQSEINSFLLSHYGYLILRVYQIEKNDEVKEIIHEIRLWVKSFLKKSHFSLFKRIKLMVRFYLPNLFRFILKLKRA